MTISPNMLLDIPVVGETLGPGWAEDLNVALETIDTHSHVPGEGVAVPTVGLNINADLPFNGFAATEVNALTLQDVTGTPADLSVYSDNGNLYYRNAAGNAVLVTDGDTIAGTVGSIAGLGDGGSSATFSDLSESFSWFYTGARLAAFNMGDIRLYPFDGLSGGGDPIHTNFITIKSPTTLGSDYSLTLPTALPGSTGFVQVSAAGQLSFTNTLANPILAANGSATAPSYSFSGDVGTDTGLYLDTENQLAFAAGGVRRAFINTTSLELSVPIYAPNGLPGSPAITFANDPDTGIYSSGTNGIGFSSGGTGVLSISSNSVNITNLAISSSSYILRNLANSSEATPTYSFGADFNTGMTNPLPDVLSFSTGGVTRLAIGTASVVSSVGINAPSFTTDGITNLKFKVFSLTGGSASAGGGLTSSTSAHGLSAGNIIAVVAKGRNSTNGQYLNSGHVDTGLSLSVQAVYDPTNVFCRFFNLTGSAITIDSVQVIVFYV